MKGKKMRERRERRQKAWDTTHGKKDGYKRPGSNKKSFPKGTK